MILVLTEEEHRSLLTVVAHNPDAKMLKRALIVLALGDGESPTVIATRVGCHRRTVYRVGERFSRDGVRGLDDRRHSRRGPQAHPTFLTELCSLVKESPRASGWARSTWSLELLGIEMKRRSGARLHHATIHRYLHGMGATFKRARPTLICPDPDREEKLAHIEQLKVSLPLDEMLFHEDEVDIHLHLNPRIGPAWMHRGEQFRIVTPGKNRKMYIAGALDHRSGELVWVSARKKRSELFLLLCKALVERFPHAKRIHIVLDNYIIHRSKFTTKVLQQLAEFKDRIMLHFLPTYSPDENPIEGVWKDLHACVTRNHDALTIEELMERVETFLTAASPYPGNRPSLARA